MVYDWYVNSYFQYYVPFTDEIGVSWLKNCSGAQRVRINRRRGSNDPDAYLHALYTMLLDWIIPFQWLNRNSKVNCGYLCLNKIIRSFCQSTKSQWSWCKLQNKLLLYTLMAHICPRETKAHSGQAKAHNAYGLKTNQPWGVLHCLCVIIWQRHTEKETSAASEPWKHYCY